MLFTEEPALADWSANTSFTKKDDIAIGEERGNAIGEKRAEARTI